MFHLNNRSIENQLKFRGIDISQDINYNPEIDANAENMDDETGLYYYGARYYDPKTSVFLGVDAMSDKYPGWSPYTYCLNNPIKLIDPDGNSAGWPIWKRESNPNADAHISTNLPGVEIKGHQTFMDKTKATLNNIGRLVASKIGKIGGGGDVLTTSRDVGVSKNNRQGDGSNAQNNVDVLSAAIGASGSDGQGAFRIPMNLKDVPEKVGQLVDGIGILNDGVETAKEMKGKFQYIIQSVRGTIQIDGTHTSESHRDTVNPGDPLPGGTQHDTIKIIDKIDK